MVLVSRFIKQQAAIETWFEKQWKKSPPPLFSSVDLRNGDFKLAPVDTNLFPAGFNNLDRQYMALYADIARTTVGEVCPEVSRLLIIAESHTRNIFYFESVAALKAILTAAGKEVRIASMDEQLTQPQQHTLPSGQTIHIEPLIRRGDKVGVADFFPCCIVLNNDLSASIPDALKNINQKIMPPIELGWTTRLKSEHFRFYSEVATSFAATIDLDPWFVMPYFDQCPEVDFMKQEGQDCLVRRCDGLLKRIHKKYQQYNIKQTPFLVVKADRGTYGMAVLMIKDPQELASLNRKQRTRMSTIKGGARVTRAIIQEGVFSFERSAHGAVVEPVIYMMGGHVLGGFYRVHRDRGPDENLNAPGMSFEPLPASPLQFTQTDALLYGYSVVARLAMLAAARELAAFRKGQ